MLPTLNGRIQTRVFVLLVIGGLWTLVISPLIGQPYAATFVVLLAVIVLGVGWELIYHLVQQFRWEKDWPTLFGLLTAINEGALLWLLISVGAVPGLPREVPFGAFLVQFLSTWIIVWVVVNGPMRVPFVHWRFRGGRLI
ncbi:hypothetical protein [Pseudonocardia abyssalis]|uniref:Uncharacterized protein n=1 Tax=Pseudonocardia abyssalis TaxID=2792008 RepID=A0ABS6UTA9_9PSEU|nr:hypothetical protein [Pseudonocardia abyssalis]MBW0119370.1 hypothetical protein [Pseudonocardia abyssalis]MBW0135462.1 hypothetical protein [Pseudonocardia abyssalis]